MGVSVRADDIPAYLLHRQLPHVVHEAVCLGGVARPRVQVVQQLAISQPVARVLAPLDLAVHLGARRQHGGRITNHQHGRAHDGATYHTRIGAVALDVMDFGREACTHARACE